jgi:septal ring factor EnvC (AmiA/AmiB activator)
MSDGVVVLGSVFALTVLFSGTRIVVALINRRPADSARLAEIEREITALSGQIDELRAASELIERQLSQLSDSQRFTEALIKGSQRTLEGAHAAGSRDRVQHQDPPSNDHGS